MNTGRIVRIHRNVPEPVRPGRWDEKDKPTVAPEWITKPVREPVKKEEEVEAA